MEYTITAEGGVVTVEVGGAKGSHDYRFGRFIEWEQVRNQRDDMQVDKAGLIISLVGRLSVRAVHRVGAGVACNVNLRCQS